MVCDAARFDHSESGWRRSFFSWSVTAANAQESASKSATASIDIKSQKAVVLLSILMAIA